MINSYKNKKIIKSKRWSSKMKLETKNHYEIDSQEQLEEKNETKTMPQKRGYGLDQYYEEERINNEVKQAKQKKKKRKKKIFLCFKILLALIILGIVFIFLFFKTSLFQKYKELWVQTAMTTMNHQYLATWFLSDEEIEKIMKELEVENNENSNSENIIVKEPEQKKEITIETITGKGYVGFVMIIPDASKVKLVDGRLSRQRFTIK